MFQDPGRKEPLVPDFALEIANVRRNTGNVLAGVLAYKMSSHSEDIRMLKRFALQPFDSIICHEEMFLPGLASRAKKYKKAQWWSTFQHKYSINVAVLKGTPTLPEEESIAYHLYTEKELKRFAKEVVALTHPEEAAIFIRGFPYIKVETGIGPRSDV
jgi:hypothetical protein